MNADDMRPLGGRHPLLFTPVRLGWLLLRNRLAAAPATRTRATTDGHATVAMARYYAGFVRGGCALVVTEGTSVDEGYSQDDREHPGLATATQAATWRTVVEAVHCAGGRIIVQLMHARALGQGSRQRDPSIALVAPHSLDERPTSYGRSSFALPRAADEAERRQVVHAFAAAASHAREAGFDGVELGGGNGYLLDPFPTDDTNRRTDRAGGAIENRLRLVCESIAAARRAVGPYVTVGIRLSQTRVHDRAHRWTGAAEAAAIFSAVAAAGVDYIHVREPDALAPAFDSGPTLAALARSHGHVAVIANGKLDDPGHAERLLAANDADMVALSAGALAHLDRPRKVLRGDPLRPFAAHVLDHLHTSP